MLSQIIRFIKLFVIILLVVMVIFFGGWYGRDLIAAGNQQLQQPVVNVAPSTVETTKAPEPTAQLAPMPQTTPEQPAVLPQTSAPPVPTPSVPADPAAAENAKPLIAFTPGETKIGNLLVKAQSAAVKIVKPEDTYGVTTVAGTLTFLVQNTGNEPISVAGTDRSLSIQYNDGTELKYAYENKVNGLSFCEASPEQCATRKPSPFTQIEPNSSPVSVSLYFENTMKGPAVKSMPLIKTGTFTTRLLVIDGAGTRNVNMSLTDFPVTNNMPKE